MSETVERTQSVGLWLVFALVVFVAIVDDSFVFITPFSGIPDDWRASAGRSFRWVQHLRAGLRPERHGQNVHDDGNGGGARTDPQVLFSHLRAGVYLQQPLFNPYRRQVSSAAV